MEVNNNFFEYYMEILKNRDRLIKYLWDTQYAKYLLALDKKTENTNNEKDMDICFEINKYPCVPILRMKEGLLVFI
jgi:hypothetical protein